jgi:hypothetical protein
MGFLLLATLLNTYKAQKPHNDFTKPNHTTYLTFRSYGKVSRELGERLAEI